MYTGTAQPIRKGRHLPGIEKFGMKIRNWEKCTLTTELSKPRQSVVMIVLCCQCAAMADGTDHGSGTSEL
jgi:hypothetical protein